MQLAGRMAPGTVSPEERPLPQWFNKASAMMLRAKLPV